MSFIMQHFRPRRREAVIGAEPVQARIVGETLRVIGEADEVIGYVEVSVDEGQLPLPVAAESRARNDAKETVSPVAMLDRVTSALCFQVIDVVYVKGRADVDSGVC